MSKTTVATLLLSGLPFIASCSAIGERSFVVFISYADDDAPVIAARVCSDLEYGKLPAQPTQQGFSDAEGMITLRESIVIPPGSSGVNRIQPLVVHIEFDGIAEQIRFENPVSGEVVESNTIRVTILEVSDRAKSTEEISAGGEPTFCQQ